MAELTITSQNFEQEVLRSELPVLLDFYADWCGPCKAFAPVLAQFAEAHEGSVKIGKINVDEEQALAAYYGVSSIPTILVFHNGKFVDQVIGLCSKAQLEALLRKL